MGVKDLNMMRPVELCRYQKLQLPLELVLKGPFLLLLHHHRPHLLRLLLLHLLRLRPYMGRGYIACEFSK